MSKWVWEREREMGRERNRTRDRESKRYTESYIEIRQTQKIRMSK